MEFQGGQGRVLHSSARLIVEMKCFSSHSALIGKLAALEAPLLTVRDLFEKLVATKVLECCAQLLARELACKVTDLTWHSTRQNGNPTKPHNMR